MKEEALEKKKIWQKSDTELEYIIINPPGKHLSTAKESVPVLS